VLGLTVTVPHDAHVGEPGQVAAEEGGARLLAESATLFAKRAGSLPPPARIVRTLHRRLLVLADQRLSSAALSTLWG
jgi:hypothetical protein